MPNGQERGCDDGGKTEECDKQCQMVRKRLRRQTEEYNKQCQMGKKEVATTDGKRMKNAINKIKQDKAR
jgi:predicted transcriptional regulator